MIESLLSSNTSNHFKFLLTPTRGKNLQPPSQKWNYDSYLQENQELQTTCSCSLYQSGQFTGANVQTSSKTPHCLLSSIKFHSQWFEYCYTSEADNLTHFMPLISFDTPCKHQKASAFLMFSGGIKRDQWHEMG